MRIAVLRFENLGEAAAEDWMGRAFSEAVSAAFAGSRGYYSIPTSTLRGRAAMAGARPVSAPGISTERDTALWAGATQVVYGQYTVAGGRIRADATVEDARTGRMVKTASGTGADVLAAATNLALRLGAGGTPLTRNAAALRPFAEALEEADPAAAAARMEQACSLDPSFAQAWLSGMELALRLNDVNTARRLAETAAAHADSMRPADRARVQFQAAVLRGDAAARRRALETLVTEDPFDPTPRSLLAALAEHEHDYSRAAALLHSALALSPADVALLNRLGYMQAYAGNMDAALATMRRYRQMQPEDANPLDSEGDVYFTFGRFQEAVRSYLSAYERDPRFNGGGALVKAAWARLLAGDTDGAGRLFDRFLSARPGDPLRDYRRAEWLWLSGKRTEAISGLDRFAAQRESGPLRDLAVRAHGQLALWLLDAGDRPAARAHAEKASALVSPQSQQADIAAIVRFLTEPPAAASEWAVRAERTFDAPGAGPMKSFALACALLMGGHYEPAVPLMRELYRQWTPEGDQAIPVMVAWAYAGAGKPAEAAPFLARYPIPQSGGLNVFTPVWFPRILSLRAKVLGSQGKTGEAQASERLYRTLS